MENEVKNKRINIELEENNHIYLRTLAGATGANLKVLVNGIITTFIKDHPEILDKASDLNKSVQKVLPAVKGV